MQTVKHYSCISFETFVTYRPLTRRHVAAQQIPQTPHRGKHQDSAIFDVFDGKIG